MLNRRCWTLLLAVGLLAAPASAQETGQYSVLAVGGTTRFDEAAGFKNDFMNTLYGGLEANYHLTSNISLGSFLIVSRPTTDAEMFPLVRLQFLDTVVYYLPSQQVTMIEFGVQGLGRAMLGRFTVEAGGGIGMYHIGLDPQRSYRPTRISEQVTSMRGMLLNLGGGISIPLPGSGALRLQVRDFIFTDYDREVLSLAEPLLSSKQVPHPRGEPPPEAKSSIHNLRFEAGFSFTPGGGS